MPELPEVETIRLGLQKYLVGHKILDIKITTARTFQGDKENIVGAKVTDIKRVGKGLIVELDNDYVLAIHLKLTGQLIYRDASLSRESRLSEKVGGKLPNKWTRVIFKLKSQISNIKTTAQKSKLENEDVSYLYFNDLRMFGWIKAVRKDEVRELPFFKEMGPEPPVAKAMEGRAILTLEKFKEIVLKANTPVKLLLMDQKKIGGIGNIYANEVLFTARIDPRRSAKQITEEETKKLYDAIVEVLERGLKYGGSSDVNYVNAVGGEGEYQQHFLVYGRKGEKCFGCKGKVEKTTLGGRGTYFCPECQR